MAAFAGSDGWRWPQQPASAESKAVVTGCYAGFFAAGQWVELLASGGTSLRALFEQAAHNGTRRDGPADGVTSHGGQLEGVPGRLDAPRRAPVFTLAASPVLLELQAAGLWSGRALTVDPRRVAISFASSKSLPDEPKAGLPWHPTDPSRCGPPALALAHLVGATGAALAPVAACATGAHAVAVGAQWIEDGYADVVLAGAMESGLTPLMMAAYASLGALSKGGTMRPFDRRRDGFVPAEGLACLILENEAGARQREARSYGRVAGWSMHGDATGPTVMCPHGDSVARAMEAALRRAGTPAIDYINAHGTATRLNDVVETRGIKQVFGTSVAVSATKPLTGHLLGAAGAVEAVLCLLAMRDNYAPPTWNLCEPDLECDLDYLPAHGREMLIGTALSLSYGFGGHIGVLVFGKV